MNISTRASASDDRQTAPIPWRRQRAREELGRAFRTHQASLAEGLYQSLRQAMGESVAEFARLDEWPRLHFIAAIEIAAKWLEEEDRMWQQLFSGWIRSRLLVSNGGDEVRVDYPASQTVAFARDRWISLLTSRVSQAALAMLTSELDRIISLLSGPCRRKLKILFIGDCIEYEIVIALFGACVEAQIDFWPILLHERVQAVLRNRLRALDPGGPDLIFFSPFSHGFVPEYNQLLRPRAALARPSEVARAVEQLFEEVQASVRLMVAHFQCPIYIHNTAGAVQTFGLAKGLVRNLLSSRNRKIAAHVIEACVSRLTADPVLEGRVRKIDENSVRDGLSDWRLAKVLHCGDLFHPTKLGVELGRRTCFTAVYSHAFLETKKLVVCDLDNTLWNGVIGEGDVEHFADRQQILKDLRNRGVLLSINSKNTPANVHFTGGVLQRDDFVAAQINWLPKVQNMSAILTELNLKVKDCVFLDDRQDELERMAGAFPEIVTLNPTLPGTWWHLAHWRDCLPLAQVEDRTKLYHERVARQAFLTTSTSAAPDPENEIAALRTLNIRVKLEEAGRSHLKRVAELINRTNQFNVCGSRTTVQELEQGLGVEHFVITASAEDKFGSMGVVGVMKVDWTPAGLEIPVFVLSCRVFGFGIEYAMLNAVKRLSDAGTFVIGHYRETQYNQPCRELYRIGGLSWDGTRWIGRVGDLSDDPSWLALQYRVAPVARKVFASTAS